MRTTIACVITVTTIYALFSYASTCIKSETSRKYTESNRHRLERGFIDRRNGIRKSFTLSETTGNTSRAAVSTDTTVVTYTSHVTTTSAESPIYQGDMHCISWPETSITCFLQSLL